MEFRHVRTCISRMLPSSIRFRPNVPSQSSYIQPLNRYVQPLNHELDGSTSNKGIQSNNRYK